MDFEKKHISVLHKIYSDNLILRRKYDDYQ